MSENTQPSIGTSVDDDDLDIDAIFGGKPQKSVETPFPLPTEQASTEAPANITPQQQPAAADAADDSEPTEEAEPAQAKDNAEQKQQPAAEPTDSMDLFAALQSTGKPSETQAQEAEPAQNMSLFDKPPYFYYGGAKEAIEDGSITFEELRIAKVEDFPELSDGKNVSWTMAYGKITKIVPDPKATTIAKTKEEIEKSKQFLDGIKKATKDKEKNPDCLVKPTITAQSKGIASYKGILATLEDAQQSDKVICLLPARDGKVYELRKTEMGDFIAPKNNVTEFAEVRAGFIPALPLIPCGLMGQLISFFRHFMSDEHEFEALAHVYWDRQEEYYTVFIPKQRVSKARIDADLRGSALPEDRYLHYADIHSHNSMAAKFSLDDDRDEKATRVYIVLGRLDQFFPTIKARISCGGVYHEIDPSLVIEDIGDNFPEEWLSSVERLPTAGIDSKKEKLLDALISGLPEVLTK